MRAPLPLRWLYPVHPHGCGDNVDRDYQSGLSSGAPKMEYVGKLQALIALVFCPELSWLVRLILLVLGIIILPGVVETQALNDIFVKVDEPDRLDFAWQP